MFIDKEILNNNVDLCIYTYMNASHFASFAHLLRNLGFYNCENFSSNSSLVEKYILKDAKIVIFDADFVGDKIFELLQIFRSDELMAIRSAPILVLSSVMNVNLLDKLIKYGCNDSLIKPFKTNDLQKKIVNLLARPQLYKSEQGIAKPTAHYSYKTVETKAKAQDLWVV